jgi:microcystin-dependent protein
MKLLSSLKASLALGILTLGAHTALAQSEPFIGQLMIVPYNFVPRGWAPCSGQLLPIGQNSALFSLIGTTYGGDGITTFALPNLNGRFVLGSGQGAGLTGRVIGQVGGQESITLTVAQLPAHSHSILASDAEASVASPSNAVMAGKARVPLYAGIGAADTAMAPTASAGGNQPAPSMPPFLTLTYCIALNGIFPARD